jgi:hypothetical protein
MPSRRATAAAVASVLVLVLVVLAITGAGKHTDLVQTTAVNPVYPVAPIKPGSQLCQGPLGVADAFDRVRVNAGTFGKPGPPLVVSVVDQDTGAELGWARQKPGWVDNGTPRMLNVGEVKAGPRVAVCVRNEGRIRAYLYGDFYVGKGVRGPLGVTPTSSISNANVDGQQLEGDIALSLFADHEHTALSWIPAIFRHAAAFKLPFVGAWTFWLLALLLLFGAPVALWVALRSATQNAEDPSLPSSRP